MASDIDLTSYLDQKWVSLYGDYLPEARAWWERHPSTRSNYGVEQTTARSYSTGARGEDGPVAVFDKWAERESAALLSDKRARAELRSRTAFEATHAQLAVSLQRHWVQRVGPVAERSIANDPLRRVTPELSVGQKYKLLDLFLRWVWIEQSDRTLPADENLAHAHLPLDRKSLQVLSATFSGILIAPKFSMGMIVTEAQYRYCQALVRLVCERAGGSPLLFDVFCWNYPEAQKLYGDHED
jgi:hypothetical protein